MDKLPPPGHPDAASNATSLKAKIVGALPWGKPAKEPAPSTDAEFNRREFVEESGTRNPEKVHFNESLQLEYKTYLTNQMSKLVDLYQINPTSLVFSSPRFRHQKVLMERLCDGNGKDGFTLNESTIETALKEDPDLWIVATQMMEEDIALTTWGLGQVAQFEPGRLKGADGVFKATAKTGHVHLNVDRGVLNRLVQSGDLQAVAGIAAIPGGLAAMGAYLTNPIFGSAIGGIAGGALGLGGVAGFAGIQSLVKDGITINTQQSALALAMMQHPTFDAEATYLEQVLGLGVSDFNANVAGNEVTRNANLPSSKDISLVQEELLSKMLTRFDFYTNKKGLNIPGNKVNMIPENIYITPDKQMGVRTKWELEIQAERNKRISQYAVDHGHPPAPVEQIRIEQEARQFTIVRRLEKALIDNLTDEDKQISILADRLAALTDGGREITNLTKELAEENVMLASMNTTLTTNQETLTTYGEKQAALTEARKKAEKAFGTSNVARLNEMLRTRNSVTDEQLETVRDELRDAEVALKNVENNGNYIDIKVSSAKILLGNITSIDASLGALGPVGLAHSDIATRPLVEILSRINEAYNKSIAGGMRPPLGWSAANNSNLARREELLFMIAEARAAESEPVVGTPSADFGTWTGPVAIGGYAVSETFFRSATVDSAIIELQRRGAIPAGVVTPVDRNRVEGVLAEVHQAYSVRMQKLNEVISQEPSQREDYNSHRADERTEIDSLRSIVQAHNAELIQLEASRDQARSNPRQIVEGFLEHNITEHKDALAQIARIHADAIGRAGYGNELDPTLLHTKSLQDILDGIGIAHRAGSALAWAPGLNSDPNNIRTVISALSEKQAEFSMGPDLTTPNTAMTELVAFGLTENQMRTLSEDQIMKRCVDRGRWTDDPGTRSHVQTAIELAKLRFDTRRNITHTNLTDALTAASSGHIPAFEHADLAFLEKDSNFRNVISTITGKLAIIRATHPALIGVGKSADVLLFTNALEAQKRSLRDFGDMSGNITAIRQEIDTYSGALQSYVAKRNAAINKGNGAQTVAELDRELHNRKEHPITELDTAISTLKDSKKTIEASSTEAIAAKKTIDEITDAFVTLSNIDAQLAAAGLAIVGLDQNTLLTLSIPHIQRMINNAHSRSVAAGMPPIGWPKEGNNNEANKNTIVRAIAGAEASVSITTVIAALPPLVQHDVRITSGLFEGLEMMPMTAEEFTTEATARGAARTPPIVIAMAPARAQKVLDAFGQVHAVYGEAVTKVSKKNTSRVTNIGYETTHIADSLEDKRQFITHVKSMAESQVAIYGRIPGFMDNVVNDPGFAAVVNPADATFSDKEKALVLRDGTVLLPAPKGYYDILNWVTDYYEDKSKGRADKFQELLNIKQLRPDNLAASINANFNLGIAPPANITQVCTRLQAQMRNQRMTRSDIYWGLRDMMDGYIKQINPMA